jgi:hypothetical protein
VLTPFIGYAVDRRFIGYVECGGERLTDLLNRSETIVVREAFVESFEDDTVANLGEGEIDRATLYAVETSGRGEEAGRLHSARHRLQLSLGPYTALGSLHDGQMPLPYLDGQGPMIPLSDATLAFASRGSLTLRDVGTLIVNRDLVDWVRAGEDEAPAFAGVPVVTDRL